MAQKKIDFDKEIRKIPPLPVTVNEIMHKINDEVHDYNILSNILSKDPGLVSRILVVANSSFYGFSGKITGIKEACLILGLHTIRHIVLTAGVLMQLSSGKRGQSNFDHQALWQHSISVGIVAKSFSVNVRADPDTAFTGGLLHDIGKFIIDVYFPNEYAKVLEYCDQEQGLLMDAEEAILGTNHCIIGAKVARNWGLPDNIIEVIQHHHRPSLSASSPIIDLVHIGNVISHHLCIGYTGNGKIPDIDKAAIARLGMDFQEIEEKLPQIKKDIELGISMLD